MTKSETQLTLHELKDRLCDQYPECGLSQWSCNALQDLVFDYIIDEDRNRLARKIRTDMGELFQQALTSLKSEMENKRREDAVKPGEIIPFDGKKKVEMHWLRKCQDAGFNQALSECQRVIDDWSKK